MALQAVFWEDLCKAPDVPPGMNNLDSESRWASMASSQVRLFCRKISIKLSFRPEK